MEIAFLAIYEVNLEQPDAVNVPKNLCAASVPFLSLTTLLPPCLSSTMTDHALTEDPRFHFARAKHIKYCLRCLQMLPTPYTSEDCSRCVG